MEMVPGRDDEEIHGGGQLVDRTHSSAVFVPPQLSSLFNEPKRAVPSDEFIRASLSYDPDTGIIRWLRDAAHGAIKAGSVAGGITPQGYRRIKIMGADYRANRLAWFLTHGVWPTHLVDHKNGVRDDDRLENLREATESQNHANSRRYASNTTGFKGVYFVKKKGSYNATIRHQNKKHCLGYFRTPEEAHAAYCAAADRLHKEFARSA